LLLEIDAYLQMTVFQRQEIKRQTVLTTNVYLKMALSVQTALELKTTLAPKEINYASQGFIAK